MAYVSTVAPRDFSVVEKTEAKKRPGFFSRLLAAMMLSRQMQADREIASFLASSGGKFTDESEREIERRFLAPKSHW